MKNKSLKGTGVALITPFLKNGKIDYNSLSKLIKHLTKGKIEYLVLMGTTGESVTLSKEEKKELKSFVIKENAGKLPLVIGIGGNNTQELIEQLKDENLDGFDAILSVSPYYNKPSQEGIYQHYKALAKVSPLPIILYNVPGRTSSNITAKTTLRLAKDFKNIIAIKEASGHLEQCMEIIKNKPENFLVISGDDNLTLPLMACGADGVISVAAHLFPKDFSDMVRSSANGKMSEAKKLHYKQFEITQQLFADGNPGGVKYGLNCLGICESYVRLPLVEPNKDVKSKLKSLIGSY
ncbi:MAG: 4-hydroxy-tetrahydrodipicolinate synthase [Bacteroidota bacterium]